ncbi:hypothetical protein TRIATDRAFT_192231, partial [Trichoderma atroviride IMI 206040]
KWRSRSTKSASETDALHNGLYASRLNSMSGPRPRYEKPRHDLPAIQQVWTPYLSESDHVFSLQHPTEPVSPAAVAMTLPRSQQSSESIVVSPSSKSHRLVNVPEIPSPESLAQSFPKTGPPTTPLLSPRLLYMRAKKEIESKIKQKHHDDSYIHQPTAIGIHRQTRATVEGTKKFLAAQNISRSGTWFKDELHTSRIGRKLFGRAPWHRKESAESLTSVSSSIRSVLKGKTPPATPANHGLSYTTNPSFFFPPSQRYPRLEAVRVSTPPMDEDTADGKPRAFFTSLTPPMPDGEANTKTAPASVRSTKRYGVHSSSSMAPQPREWWEQIPQRGCRRDLLDANSGSTGRFEFDVPEHLPRSPMCPANKRHKSGGAGVCVYHGRRRAGSILEIR